MKAFGSNQGVRTGRHPRIPHGTIVAYVALFFALCGSGYAATQVSGPIARAAKARGLKVHCTARQGGKKVKCQAVVGVVTGPRGPRGFIGPPGKSGTGTGGGGGGGATVFVQPPSYTLTNLGNTSCDSGADGINGSGAPSAFDQTQAWTASSNCAKGNGYQTDNIYYRATGIPASESATFTTYLQTPSQVDGTASNLDSVQFCYGDGNATAGTGTTAQSATMTITQAEVYEIDEPTVASSGGGAPAYKHELLLNDPINLTGGSNCATVKPASTAPVDPAGYLFFQIFTTFKATAGSYANSYGSPQANTATVPLTLGRITTTYGP